MRTEIAAITAFIYLAAAVIAAAMAVLQLMGWYNPVEPIPVQFGVWFAVILSLIALIPRRHFERGSDFRDVNMKLHPDSFRDRLTGPFAEMGQRSRSLTKDVKWMPLRQIVLIIFFLALMLMAHAFLPFGLWGASMFLARSAAFEGNPMAISIERFLGSAPKLKRNRLRAD